MFVFPTDDDARVLEAAAQVRRRALLDLMRLQDEIALCRARWKALDNVADDMASIRAAQQLRRALDEEMRLLGLMVALPLGEEPHRPTQSEDA